MQKAILDWCLGGAAATEPANWWLQWATASPTTASAFDGPLSPRMTATFGSAQSPAGSCTAKAQIAGTATAACTVVGWNIYDASVDGNRLIFGTLASAVGLASGDNPIFQAVGANVLKITLA